MDEPTESDLFGLVRSTYAAGDPVPKGLVSRMQAAVAGAAEESGLGLDLELMLLVESTSVASGTRSATSSAASDPTAASTGERSAYTLRFSRTGVDVLLRVAPDGDTTSRLDGWVVPVTPMTVRALRADDLRTFAVAVELGDSGRFEMTGLPSGLVRLRFEPQEGEEPAFLTPTFEI